ncbi:MAG: DNA polymerase III subunit delta [Alphaproteobacteria bacterium]|nr:DNA polymerase III subunit delta [Alphaproteobacteria bacterium]
MKIPASKASRFAAEPDPALAAVLVYGPDLGLVAARTEQIATAFAEDLSDPFRVARLDGGVLRKDPARFWDEVAALSLTGGRRVVIMTDVGDAQAADFSRYLDEAEQEAPGDGPMVIVQAGELAARSKLRKAAEASDRAAAVACYPLEGATLREFITARLAKDAITADRAAVDYLAYALGENQGLRESELAKLALYGGQDSHLTLDDVMACVAPTADAAMSELALAAASGDLETLERQAARAWVEGIAPVTAIRALQHHFQRLYRAARRQADGMSSDQAMATLRPPVFWKEKQRFSAQLRVWPADALKPVLMRLLAAETALKSTGMPDRVICHREMLAVAQRARRLAR